MDFYPPKAGGQGATPNDLDKTDDPVSAPKPKGGKLRFDPPKILQGEKGYQARQELAAEIVNMIYQAETTMPKVNTVADEVDEIYLGRHVPSMTPLFPGAPEYNAKTLGNKLKQLVSFVAGPMVALDPYFIIRAGGPKGNPIDAVQSALHYFLYQARYALHLEETINLVARRGRCPVRVTYHGRKSSADGTQVEAGHLEFMPIDTKYLRLYPNNTTDIKKARLFGYIYQPRVREIDEEQRAGRYFSDIKIRNGIEKLQMMGEPGGYWQQSTTNAIYRQDDPADIFDGVLRKDLDGDGFEELYHVRVAKWQRVLLRIEKFQLNRPWYADFFFEREHGRYINENSVAIDLIDPHKFVNDCLNLMVQGSMSSLASPMFTDAWTLDDEVTRPVPGKVYAVEGLGKVYSNGTRTDLAVFPKLYELGRDVADETGKVSQNGLGANLAPGTTATEASQVAQGQNIGIRGVSNKVAYGCVDVAMIALELLGRNFNDWWQDYQDVVPQLTQQDLLQRYWIEVNGTNPVDTPQAVIQQVQAILEVVQTMMQMAAQGSQNPILAQYPDILKKLLRCVLESSSLANKESILPTPEEEAAMDQQQMAAHAQQQLLAILQSHGVTPGNQQSQPIGPGGNVQQPGMGLLPQAPPQPQGAFGAPPGGNPLPPGAR